MRCAPWSFQPMSAESAFCVVGGSSGDQRLIERDLQPLVRATDAYIKRQHALEVRQKQRAYASKVVPFVPILVTNAKLFVAHFNHVDVSLQTAAIDSSKRHDIGEAPWVRFTKSFLTADGNDVGSRTVFIVNALELRNFLFQLGIAGTPSAHDQSPLHD
jgi:hypothetical protein